MIKYKILNHQVKKYASIILLFCFVGFYVFWYYSPKHYASSADYIPEFFGLPSNSVSEMTILDELHSQGKTTFSFGVNHYWLKFQDTREAAYAIKEAGGSENRFRLDDYQTARKLHRNIIRFTKGQFRPSSICWNRRMMTRPLGHLRGGLLYSDCRFDMATIRI